MSYTTNQFLQTQPELITSIYHADLITCAILQTSMDQYFEYVYTELKDIPKDEDFNIRIATIETRVALVIYSLFSIPDSPPPVLCNQYDDSIKTSLINRINNLIIHFYKARQSQGLECLSMDYFPTRCLLHIIDYLLNCLEELEKKYTENTIVKYYNMTQQNDKLLGVDYCTFLSRMYDNNWYSS